MASSFSDLGIELMATGENAGVWGDKTNTNLQIVEKAIAGYVEKSIAGGAQTTTLTIEDGDSTESTSIARHAVIKLTGSITGNQVVTVPDSIEKVFIVTNGTSGAFTVQFKTVSGTGITFGVSEKTTKLFYSDGTNIVDAGFSGGNDLDGKELILDADGDTSITADTDDQIDIKIAGADDFQFTANTFTAASGSSVVIPDSGLTLGSTAVTSTAAELNLLDGVSGLVQADLTKLAAVDSTAAELNIVDGGTSATSTTVADADRVVLNDNGTMVQVAVTDLAAYFDDEITAMPNLTSVGTLTTLTVDNIIINGANIGHTSDADALAIDSSGNVTASQNLIVTGDLTVSGDDITMGTNTAGNLLVADGTNFNSIAATSLSEISTIANDDVFLAVDTSGGGLKKVARSTIVSGLATSSALSNVVEDTSPQLGGNLDMNGADIVTTSNATIDLAPNGTGTVVVRGNTNSGAIVFNCESNSHGQTVIAQPHSASVTNTMLLPAGANSTLVSLVSTDTLTNKTLTSPKINEDVAVTTTATELNLIDGDTSRGTTAVADADGILHNDAGTMRMTSAATFKTYFTAGVSSAADDLTAGDAAVNLTTSSGNITIDAAANDSDIIFKGTDATADITMLTLDGSAAGAATFNDKVIATELDISGDMDIDGTSNLDAVDIDGAVQIDNTLTVGVDDTGYDVKFFGASAGAYLEWDQSADQLRILGASADATTSTGKLLLATALTDINANDIMGKIDFQAPLEAGGTDAITVAASIQAMATATFSSSVNATDLLFFTGHSEAATEKFRFTSQGEIGIGGDNVGTDGQVLTSGGAGAAAAWEDVSGGAGGATGLDLNDSVKIRLGTGNDTELFFDGTNTIFDHTSGSGGLFIRADGIAIQDSQGTPVNYIDVNQGSGVVFNEGSNDHDFRIESNASSHFFNLDGNNSTLSFGGDDASDDDKGKFKILADGQTRFGGLAGNPNPNGGTGLTATDSRTGSFMLNKSGGMTHQTTDPNSYWNYRGSTSNESYWNFRYGGTGVGSILWNSTAVAFNTSSDYRLKENVDYSWDATTRLKQLKPARFNWIADETNTLVDGFIAHEAATVVPESVTGTKDAVEQYDEFSEEVQAETKNVGDNKLDADGNTIMKPQAIDHSKLVPLMVKTIQELETRIKTLEDA